MILLLFVTPVLMICSEESKEPFALYVLLMPMTVAWALLLVAYCLVRNKVKAYYTKVQHLMETNPTFKQNATLQKIGAPVGRLTKHCRQYRLQDFEVRFLENFILVMLFAYFGVFLKVYIFDLLLPELAESDDSILKDIQAAYTWQVASAVSYAPIFLMYCHEIISESCRSQYNRITK